MRMYSWYHSAKEIGGCFHLSVELVYTSRIYETPVLSLNSIAEYPLKWLQVVIDHMILMHMGSVLTSE